MKKKSKAILWLTVTAGLLLASNIQQYRLYEKQQLTLLQAEHELDQARAQHRELTARVESLRRMEPMPRGISQHHLRGIISGTLEYLGVKQRRDWERLLLLTVVTESDCGAYTRQLRGPARGAVQMEPETERHVLAWLRAKQPDMYAKVKALRVPAKLTIHELEYNNGYGVAMAYSLYVMRKANPHGKTTRELAGIYKRLFNTVKGKATVDGVLAKLDTFGVRI